MKNLKNTFAFLFVFMNTFICSHTVHAVTFFPSLRVPSVFTGLALCCRPVTSSVKSFAQSLFDRFGFVNRTQLHRKKEASIDNLRQNTEAVQEKLQRDIETKQQELLEKIDQLDKGFNGQIQNAQQNAKTQFGEAQRNLGDLKYQITKNNLETKQKLHEGGQAFETKLNELQKDQQAQLGNLQQQLEQNNEQVTGKISSINGILQVQLAELEKMRDQVENIKAPLTDQQRRKLTFTLGRIKGDPELLNKHGAAGAVAITLGNRQKGLL